MVSNQEGSLKAIGSTIRLVMILVFHGTLRELRYPVWYEICREIGGRFLSNV